MTDQDRFEYIEEVRNLYRDQGAELERKRIIEMLEEYFELSNLDPIAINPEWDAGFQASIALIKKNKND